MTVPRERPGPRPAGRELLVLDRFEAFTGWLFERTARWPKRARFTITQRLENHALDAVEELVIARYQRAGRARRLAELNLRLERMRHLLRLALGARVCGPSQFESAVRALDEVGRMLHGWRNTCESDERDAPHR